ncbi:hypothetical protein N8D56_09900 [Devosia sp. A8/3-2]|nr:hypothetical protein N8D56_09900 [Devosia sp. A8/3-2]
MIAGLPAARRISSASLSNRRAASMSASIYPTDFYDNRRAHTAHAAARLLAALPKGPERRSVADIGCGTGTGWPLH